MKARKTNWDSAGLVVRDQEGARVLFPFNGSYYNLAYDEFLRLPFIKTVGLRVLITDHPKTGNVNADLIKSKKAKTIGELFSKYWKRTGLADGPEKCSGSADDIDRTKPEGLKGAEYAKMIIVQN